MFKSPLTSLAFYCAALLFFTPLAAGQDTLPPPPLDAPPEQGEPFESEGRMTPLRLADLIQRLDPEAVGEGNTFTLNVEGRPMRVIFDERADRMRVITPIVAIEGIPPELLARTLQANFDAVLDARYAIGNGQLWSVFVHPLSSLNSRDFISGVAQTAIAAQTFGTTFTSGVFVFGGGDSQSLHEDLRRRLEEAAQGDERGI